MALEQRTKLIVFNEGFTDLTAIEATDPTVDNFDYALPVVYFVQTAVRRAERLDPIVIKQAGHGRGVVTPG